MKSELTVHLLSITSPLMLLFQAEQEDLLYIPLPGKTQEGKQVYRFGKASIYYDHNVVFMQAANGQWLPTSLNTLTEAAK